jgi:anti-sigma B factor antagonist
MRVASDRPGADDITRIGYARAFVQSLAVERTTSNGIELVVVEGEIDIATSPRLITTLNKAVLETTRSLIVDLTRVNFMDSTGLALLLNAHRRVARRGHGFAIVCPGGPLLRVFQVTDMVDTLHVQPDRRSATRAADGSPSRFI